MNLLTPGPRDVANDRSRLGYRQLSVLLRRGLRVTVIDCNSLNDKFAGKGELRLGTLEMASGSKVWRPASTPWHRCCKSIRTQRIPARIHQQLGTESFRGAEILHCITTASLKSRALLVSVAGPAA